MRNLLLLLLLPISLFAQLPSSGSLSIKSAAGVGRSISQQVDGNETGSKSLTTLSITAGKTAPHSILEFYGYPSGPALPGTVTGCTASITQSAINLSWTNPASGGTPEGVEIRVSVNGGAYSLLTTVSYPGTSHTTSGLTGGNSYTYTFTAVNATGSGTACGPTSSVYFPIAPGIATCSSTLDAPGIDLSWAKSTVGDTPTATEIKRSVNGGSHILLTTVTWPSTTYTDLDISEGNSYQYSFRIYNNGGYSPACQPASVTYPVTAPGSVSNITLTNINPSGIELGWDAPSSGGTPTNYRVEMSEDGGPFTFYVNSGTSVTVIINDADLTDGLPYQFRIRAENSAGNSAYVTSGSIVY